MPVSSLHAYLQSGQFQSRHVPLEALHPFFSSHAMNQIGASSGANDLLEFVGDRVLNLACALIVDELKVCQEQFIFVIRKISNNDTLGRIAFSLRFDTYAELSPENEHAIDSWALSSKKEAPPKALADLFESFIGAFYMQHGWFSLVEWLRLCFKPLAELATEDYFRLESTTIPAHVATWWRRHGQNVSQPVSRAFYKYLHGNQPQLSHLVETVVDAIPLSTKLIFSKTGELLNDCDKAEVGYQLMCHWICLVFMNMLPTMACPHLRVSHMASSITNVVVCERTLAVLAHFGFLSSFFDVDDPDFNSSLSPAQTKLQQVYLAKLSLAFRVAIGWLHSRMPNVAHDWGVSFFEPLVVEACRLLMDQSR
ncbi:unnamed protein product [Mycena citricolor]|uniref:RNase III domain-containing protein n=1 Tax=Mycena citricolor TaxID=2018698 RepID=A0AAD2GW69_9AGAR|nr:unnamed protein product [Mycena citricolor]CAK5278324.1 unnamed protein product [Mycena citricolor]